MSVPNTDKTRPLRIAWIGVVRDGGGVPGMGRELLEGVLRHGAEVDFFSQEPSDCLNSRVHAYPNLRIQIIKSWFQWNRWYSRQKFFSFLSSTVARSQAAKRISQAVIEQHKSRQYDCVFQLSQTELFDLGKPNPNLLPLVIYPCVHAAGELRWHRIESRYARQSEAALLHFLTRAFLVFRSRVQKRDLNKATTVVGMSRRFTELVVQDYGINPNRTAVLYHPIRPVELTATPASDAQAPMRLLYISRISVRKGVEMIIELSRRLADLKGKVLIEVIGDRTLWSDYTAHLKDLNPQIAIYAGQLANDEVRRRLNEAVALLLPSHYEPGGLVVGEALSAGVPVVVSEEVGSGEPVNSFVCRRFAAGDMDAFEREVRQLLEDAKSKRDALRTAAIAEADRHFAPRDIATELLRICGESARSRKPNPIEPATTTAKQFSAT